MKAPELKGILLGVDEIAKTHSQVTSILSLIGIIFKK